MKPGDQLRIEGEAGGRLEGYGLALKVAVATVMGDGDAASDEKSESVTVRLAESDRVVEVGTAGFGDRSRAK